MLKKKKKKKPPINNILILYMQKLLHNRYVLYTVFLLSLINVLYLGYIEDMSSVTTFVLIGLLTSFFSKNMIIILAAAIVFTNVLKMGGITDVNIQTINITQIGKEGLTDEEGQKEGEEEEEKATSNSSKSPEKKSTKNKKAKIEETHDDNDGTIKEEFGQDEKVVYTSVEDQSISDEDKMILAQEKLLEKMNKYKPLLDTIQGISKSMATMKQLSHDSSSINKETVDKNE